MRNISGILFLVIALCLLSSDSGAQTFDLIDSALAQVGMTAGDLHFDQDEMATWGGDHWRLSHFTMFHHHPLKLPKYGELTLEFCKGSATDITALVVKASRFVDQPIRRGLIGDPLEPYLVFPDTVVKPSITRSNNILAKPEYASLRDRIDLIYALADDDESLFRKGLDGVNKDKYRDRLMEFFAGEDDSKEDDVYEIIDKVDFSRLLAGAQDMVEAARRFTEFTELLAFPDVRMEFKTRKGLIVVGSTGDDHYQYYVPPLLIVDGGGNDTYEFSGYPDKYPWSVIVDYDGDDYYLSTDSTKPGIGGAVLGVSVVIDQAGNDRYEGVNFCQGAGLFGVGVLLDRSGNDTYVSDDWSQGSGAFGIGVLSDGEGRDSMYCMSTSQGFGYTRGCGLLVNLSGDDWYVAEDSDIVNPSSQSP